MPNTPLTNSRIPDSTYATDIADIIHKFAYDVEVNAIPRFTTTSTRDAAYNAYTAAGGVLNNGRCCWTDDAGFWDRVGGAWVRRYSGGTGPQSITPVSGWTPITAGGEPGLTYEVVGKLCVVNFRLNGVSSWAGGNTVWTQPVGARPLTTASIRITKDNSDGVASGRIRITNAGAAIIDIAGSAGNDIYGTQGFFIP